MDPDVVGATVGARLADVRAAMERQSAFVVDAEDNGPTVGGTEDGAARGFVLRAMAALADPLNYRMLLELRRADTSTAELAARLGLDGPAVWERVNDLVQVRLAARALERDRVGLTAAGCEVVDFVEAAAAAADRGAAAG